MLLVVTGGWLVGCRSSGTEAPATIVYTQSHVDYVVEGIVELFARRREIGGLRFVHRPAVLPHFTAVLGRRGTEAPGIGAEVAGAVAVG